jgi:hypothetical protein
MSPVLVLHIVGGSVGLFSGFVAIFLRKGSNRHRVAGNIFVGSMLTLAATGVYLATLKSEPANILGGTLTFYMVATAWITGRYPSEPRLFNWAALSLISAVAIGEMTCSLAAAMSPNRMKYGFSPAPYFIFGSIALIAVAGDILHFWRGLSRTQRIARHLWRMCFALFVASVSIFLARQQLFPAILRETGALVFASVLPLLLMIYWLIRVIRTRAAIYVSRPKSEPPTTKFQGPTVPDYQLSAPSIKIER